MNELFQINQNLETSKGVLVYGTGRMALLTMTSLLQVDIEVVAFGGKCVGEKIMGKKVVSPDELKLLHEKNGLPVIFAGEDFTTVESEMNSLGIKNYWVDTYLYSIVNDCVWTFM